MNAHLNHNFNFVSRLHRIDAQILAVRKFTHKVTRYYYYDITETERQTDRQPMVISPKSQNSEVPILRKSKK